MNKRIYMFDNMKAILIFLVLIGHFFTKFKSGFDIIRVLYTGIYAFHMPCFLFINGYFAKNIVKDGKFVKQKILNYFLLYIIFQIVLCLFLGAKIDLFTPKLALWYLLVLIMYTLLMPLICKFERKWAIIFSIILGVISCIGKTTEYFSMTRFFVFLPFYLLGYYFDINYVKKFF